MWCIGLRVLLDGEESNTAAQFLWTRAKFRLSERAREAGTTFSHILAQALIQAAEEDDEEEAADAPAPAPVGTEEVNRVLGGSPCQPRSSDAI